ncbi:DnaJ C-terminal domain-containing protein [Roseateles albus]|uniref:DnaJ C-terminal domain-containing protein n=1 Tax=Roseateles albus TaxID=2987525 RepID=A0ABT5KIS2_9BURK|nr:DnaJ C-terminal domain-containing protein [Roseateles albus]MDC8773404.1 DnaJ C-terminal domain-containing protein [Roseateles albus]
MEFKDYYRTLGLERSATADQIKRAYRKLARKYHPDVSKEPDAEARFKEVAEAHEALCDVERRAAYDAIDKDAQGGKAFKPAPGWSDGFAFEGGEFAGGPNGANGPDGSHSSFFEALFGRQAGRGKGRGAPHEFSQRAGADQHAKVSIALLDAYRGAERTITLHVPMLDAGGAARMQNKRIQIRIPKGIQAGQHLRLAGQGHAGAGDAPPGDLYLEIAFLPDARFRVEGGDVFMDLPLAPWEAALGATVTVQTPDGELALTVPPASKSGRKLRLKGRGLPAFNAGAAGDLYAVLQVQLPPADTQAAEDAYRSMAAQFSAFNPRVSVQA